MDHDPALDLVDLHRRRSITLTQATDDVERQVLRVHASEPPLQIAQQLVRPAQVARHIHADARRNLRRWRQQEVRKEIGYAVDVSQRRTGTPRQGFHLTRGQEPEAALYFFEVVENQSNRLYVPIAAGRSVADNGRGSA